MLFMSWPEIRYSVYQPRSQGLFAREKALGTRLSVYDRCCRPYVFTPVDVTAKWALCGLFSTIGCLGFFGNCLLLYFLWKKPRGNSTQRSSFMKNFNLYVKSMSLSDIFSCALSLPLICIQILFNVFQTGWA